ncbi:DUF397 domain-containing protein [Streptomyces sp. H10-C2]|uniref:DUF397 domain-containing protein n=1 Tax=unclassified Streptomyces TaxID=2593676 RepID=UPI0024B888D4|nr:MULTISPECIES: DUF397 domain-containing protein [unclassified Streptomyces]MDJ0344627.1 DUF397 domain-containing protein [Streptomyces sp. PH10-H1]MDJ0373213.1 DUF397 domain-containing protein [Streptomyces sp. H10-C2]
MSEINWQKSSYSGQGDGADCVELATVAGTIRLRESDDPQAIVTTTPAKLKAFLLGVQTGRFDHLG